MSRESVAQVGDTFPLMRSPLLRTQLSLRRGRVDDLAGHFRGGVGGCFGLGIRRRRCFADFLMHQEIEMLVKIDGRAVMG